MPLSLWLWIGGSLMAVGTVLAAFPGRAAPARPIRSRRRSCRRPADDGRGRARPRPRRIWSRCPAWEAPMSEVLEQAASRGPLRRRGGRARLARLIAVGRRDLVGALHRDRRRRQGWRARTPPRPRCSDCRRRWCETTTIDGRPFDLASRRRGSWVVLNFFSTWCRPCVEEHPELVRFATGQAAQPDGAELYSVIFNDDTDEVEQLLRRAGRRLAEADRTRTGGSRWPSAWPSRPRRGSSTRPAWCGLG